jgi:hypothetical protein
MNILEFAVLLLVAGALGILAQRITGLHVGGLIAAVALGFGGGYLGKELALWLSLPDVLYLSIGGRSFPVIWAILGASAVTFLVGWIQRTMAKRRARQPVHRT